MRSTMEIDEKLLAEAMRLTDAKTKKEVVRLSLVNLIRKKRRERLKGKLNKFPLALTQSELKKMRGSR